jgi:acetyl-CoA C-acetyltransferase
MSLKGKAYIAGAYEHPIRRADDKSVAQLHAEVARGALADAGLTLRDVDGYFCAGDAPGLGALSHGRLHGPDAPARRHHRDRWLVLSDARRHAAAGHRRRPLQRRADHAGRAARRPRAWHKHRARNYGATSPDVPFESPYAPTTVNGYAMVARRHMHEHGTTAEQLAWIRVAASHHAQHNPHAMLRTPVTVEDVVNSPMVSDPLHRLDCCVVSDGGGALVVVRPEIARQLKRPALVKVMGAGEFGAARRSAARSTC